ncbi:hypothetical protein GN956_G8703 [Arapaima gigas]
MRMRGGRLPGAEGRETGAAQSRPSPPNDVSVAAAAVSPISAPRTLNGTGHRTAIAYSQHHFQPLRLGGRQWRGGQALPAQKGPRHQRGSGSSFLLHSHGSSLSAQTRAEKAASGTLCGQSGRDSGGARLRLSDWVMSALTRQSDLLNRKKWR